MAGTVVRSTTEKWVPYREEELAAVVDVVPITEKFPTPNDQRVFVLGSSLLRARPDVRLQRRRTGQPHETVSD